MGQLVGAPNTVAGAGRHGERWWIPRHANARGSQWEWDITVGPEGKVADVTSCRE
ncbi:MAG TPA: hypothetical protein VNU21_17430 [Usitatibacter sp.]|nr:hypothetical protein [Usitatibacter sp.]